MKFCKDCVHFKLPYEAAPLSIGLCARKDRPADPVTGFDESEPPHPYCKAERVSVTGNCGFDALFFQPKPKDVSHV